MSQIPEPTDNARVWARAVDCAKYWQGVFERLSRLEKISRESVGMLFHANMRRLVPGATGSGLQTFSPFEGAPDLLVFGLLDEAYAKPHFHPQGELVVTVFGELFDRDRDGCIIRFKAGEALELEPGSFHQPWAEGLWLGLLVQPEAVALDQMSMQQLQAALAWRGSKAPWHQRWPEVGLLQAVLWVKEAYEVRDRAVLAV